MGRGTASVTMSPGKGTTTSAFKPSVSSQKSMKPTIPASHKTTTAPAVKAPAITMVTDTKSRTARERAVDAYNANADGYRTALERQFGQIAESDRNTGSQSTVPGRSKQAQ